MVLLKSSLFSESKFRGSNIITTTSKNTFPTGIFYFKKACYKKPS
jgi:hypothetical protein